MEDPTESAGCGKGRIMKETAMKEDTVVNATASRGCCGGPAPEEAGSCCVRDADAKAAGEAGCGCITPAAPKAPAPAAPCCG